MSRNQYKHLTWYSVDGTETAVVSAVGLPIEPATQPISNPVSTIETRQVIANVEPFPTATSPTVESRQVIANVETYDDYRRRVASGLPIESRQVIADVETYDDYRRRVASELPIIVDGSPLIIPRSSTGGGGGGGGGGAFQPSSKSGNVAPVKSSVLKRNLLPIIIIASAVFIFIKKPLN